MLLLLPRRWRLCGLGREVGYVVKIDIASVCIAVPAEHAIDGFLQLNSICLVDTASINLEVR